MKQLSLPGRTLSEYARRFRATIRYKPQPFGHTAFGTLLISLIGLPGSFQPASRPIPLNHRPGSDKPNIVILYMDDMGYADPSCFGNRAMTTPNIDRLAKEGMRFTQYYSNSPICSPSRVALNTGQYPQRYRVHSHFDSRAKNRERDMVDYLDPQAPTLARALQKAGYQTGHFGKWHMGGGRNVLDAPEPNRYGFTESFVDNFEGMGPGEHHEKLPKSHSTDAYVDKAIDFIGRHKDQPFFLNLCPNDVHDPFEPKKELRQKYARAANAYQRDFDAVLDNLDQQIGRFMQKLTELDLDDNTLIIFTSDNGPTDWPYYYQEGVAPPGSTGPFFGRKWSLYEGGIREPFIIRWKGVIPAGRTNEKTVLAAMDLYPSLCRLAGVPVNASARLDGLDMSRALRGLSLTRQAPICWDYRRNSATLKPGNPKFVSPNLAMRHGDWKLLIYADSTNAQLYDLKRDKGEQRNVIGQHPAVAQRMAGELLAWRKSLP